MDAVVAGYVYHQPRNMLLFTIKFGPQFVQVAGGLLRHHLSWVLAVLAVGLALWLLVLRQKRNGRAVQINAGSPKSDEA
jgi:hypothetical protein